MPYIKWNEPHTAYEIWHGPSIGPDAMAAKGYEKVDVLPEVTPEEPALENMTFSKYKVAQKLMDRGIWESVKGMLTDAQKEFLYLAQDFSLKDENFNAIYAQLKTQIADLNELLRECAL